jgi:FtsP/CotA-like multicopper oxidase with cupredoxin domain
MRATNMKKAILQTQMLLVAVAMLLASTAHAAAPGITGTTFNLTAKPAFITQPDGNLIYSWGYGCTSAPSGFAPRPGVGPATAPLANANCPDMQVPGPTLIVSAGTTFTVVLTNGLPNAAGNTSLLFPGLQVSASGGAQGLLTREAVQGSPVTYTVTVPATAAGTHAYYSGTQGDLQVEMGLYGAVIVVPSAVPSNCTSGIAVQNRNAQIAHSEQNYRLAAAAYNHPQACYDREYLFQFSEIDPRIHRQAEEQVLARANCVVGSMGCSLNVATEPYLPAYFMVNGRSMPDLMDSNYAPEYPHQPYNGNPHMHPGELVLVRVVGQGRWQHPFHEHGNHVRILGRDGNLIASQTNPATNLAGPLLFTTSTTPGQAVDGIFYWTGKGLNWDAYGHHPSGSNPNVPYACVADANGYYTSNASAINYYEWCQDHNKPLEKAPFGNVATNGPVTLPDATILANGAWFGGSPYLGPDATTRAVGFTGTTPPSGTIANPPTEEAGFAYMWHSHNEREITTNNIFPGGMMMMMLVDSREFSIDESN